MILHLNNKKFKNNLILNMDNHIIDQIFMILKV